jgi:hypothetical protein
MTEITGQQVAKTGAGMVGGHYGRHLGAWTGATALAALATGPVGWATYAAWTIGGAVAGHLAGRAIGRGLVDSLMEDD